MEENLLLIFGKNQRAALSVRGKDRALFLHRLLTQDIKGTPAGQARPVCLLDRVGKIQFAGLAHIQPEEILLELRADDVNPARSLLEKYLISEAVQITPSPLDAPSAHRPEFERLSAGVPAIGKEITSEVIPNELGPVWLEKFVSFTKGCYIGQEIVARIHYRAHPPRLLTFFTLNGPAPERSPIYLKGNDVGILTSVATHPVTGHTIAFGFLKHGTPPDPFQVGSPAGPLTATPVP